MLERHSRIRIDLFPAGGGWAPSAEPLGSVPGRPVTWRPVSISGAQRSSAWWCSLRVPTEIVALDDPSANQNNQRLPAPTLPTGNHLSSPLHTLNHLSSPLHTRNHLSSPLHPLNHLSSPLHTRNHLSSPLHTRNHLSSPLHTRNHLSSPLHTLNHLSSPLHTRNHLSSPFYTFNHLYVLFCVYSCVRRVTHLLIQPRDRSSWTYTEHWRPISTSPHPPAPPSSSFVASYWPSPGRTLLLATARVSIGIHMCRCCTLSVLVHKP